MTKFDEAEARALFDDGGTCRSIAKALHASPSTVSRWAKREGLSFDRAQTDMATQARRVDLAAARTELAQLMFIAARDALLELEHPVTVYSFGGRDNEFNSHEFDQAPIEIRRQVMSTAGIAFDKINRIVETSEETDGLAAAESMLGRLAVRFGLAEG